MSFLWEKIGNSPFFESFEHSTFIKGGSNYVLPLKDKDRG